MYKVIYIDEERHQAGICYQSMKIAGFSEVFEFNHEFPLKDLESQIERIKELAPDVIISDHKLNDQKEDIEYDVDFTGVQLREEIVDMWRDFPCFVTTSYESDAIESVDENVHYIYPKSEWSGDASQQKVQIFWKRVRLQVKIYQAKLANSKTRFIELSEKESLKESEILELEKLDDFLTGALHEDLFLSKKIKSKSSIESISDLITKAENILSKIDGA